VVQSYASLAASLDAASFPPLTRRKPVSSPIRSHKNHRETRGRERQEKKQEALVPLPGEHSALQALAPDDPIVEDLEAKVMANFVKFERNMTRLVEEREAALHKQAPKLNMARVFGSWCWKYDHMAKGFQKKSDRQIFVHYRWIHPKWDIFRILYPESPSGPFLLI